MLRVVDWDFRVLTVLFIIRNSGNVVGEVHLTSSYSGTNVTVQLHHSVTFNWTFTGSLDVVTFGTKRKTGDFLDQTVLTLQTNGVQLFNVPLYNGRVNGSWNGESPGEVSVTLNTVKKVDDRIFFLCIFSPTQLVAAAKSDSVQLIVQDPPKATIKPSILPTPRGVPSRLICNASGFPDPNIKWMRQTGSSENEIVSNGGNYQINPYPGSSELIVKLPTTKDQGYYLCEASNFKSDVARAYVGVISLYVEYDLCPESIQATIGESKTICCPVKGFPLPYITWQLPNGAFLKSEDINLRVVVKEYSDFGRYRCTAQGVEETVAADVTIREKAVDPDVVVHNKSIVLNPGDKFFWEEVPKALEYLLRMPDTLSTEAITLLGCNVTSAEIPYSSLIFKNKNVDERPRRVKVIIEVEAVGESGSRGKINRYINVDIRASAITVTVSLMTLMLSLAISSFVGLCCHFNFSTPWYMHLAVAGWFERRSDSAGYTRGSFTPGRFNLVGQAKEE